MCYAKPGRRCQAHAAAHLNDLKAKHKLAVAKVNSLSARMMVDQSVTRSELRTVWKSLIAYERRIEKAQIDYDATETGMNELRALAEVDPSDKKIADRLKYATLRAHWQTLTYETLKDIEKGNGFGKKFALRDAIQEATRDLAFQQEKLKKYENSSDYANTKNERHLTQLAVQDLTSYVETAQKKLDKELELDELMRRQADKLLEGKTFITMPADSQ